MRVNYNIPDNLFSKLRKKSEELGIPMTQIIIRALENYFKKEA